MLKAIAAPCLRSGVGRRLPLTRYPAGAGSAQDNNEQFQFNVAARYPAWRILYEGDS
jgi:hypothetical protein